MPEAIKSHRCRFMGAYGDELVGQLDTSSEPIALCILAHCFTCSKDIKHISRLSRHWARSGFACLRFDFTGVGESSGDFSRTDLTSRVLDIQRAAAHLSDHYGEVDFLLGHSFGGCCALVAASDLASVKGVVTMSSPSDTSHMKATLLKLNPSIMNGVGAVQIGPGEFMIRRTFFDDLSNYSLVEVSRRLGLPQFWIHSKLDETVPYQQALEWPQSPGDELMTLNRSDHLFSNSTEEFVEMADAVVTWMSARLSTRISGQNRKD